MNYFPWPVARSGETPEDASRRWEVRERELDQLPPEELLKASKPGELGHVLLDRFLARLPEKLTPAQRRIVAVAELFAEVRGHGLDEYFLDSSGDLALDAREGLGELGLSILLPAFDCALAAFPDGQPNRDRAKRQEQLARLGDSRDELGRLNEPIWSFDGEDAIFDYIETHGRELAGP